MDFRIGDVVLVDSVREYMNGETGIVTDVELNFVYAITVLFLDGMITDRFKVQDLIKL